MPRELVQEYDKIFRDLLSQILATIDGQLLVQCFVLVLLQKIGAPLRMHEITTKEESLKKALQVESDDECYTSTFDYK